MDQSSAAVNGVASAVRTLLVTLGTGLVTTGVLTKESPFYFWIMTIAGLALVVIPGAWGVWVAIEHWWEVRRTATQAVNAGINLVVAGHALNTEGKPITLASDGKPLPATPASAQAIIHDFGTGSG